MSKILISESTKSALEKYFKTHRKHELVSTYFYYLEKEYSIHPIIFPFEKKIYQSIDHLIKSLEEKNSLWRETEIKIRYGKSSINESTKRIYICPFSGKVFGDNTHPNPQDAIYDWVSTCPENTERKDGIRVKRFFVSDDPEIISSYIKTNTKSVVKKVYSSAISNKLFNTKKAVIDDFINNYTKEIELINVQSQNRFEIEDSFMNFLSQHLTEEKISQFVETLSKYKEFTPYINDWIEDSEEE